jgi:hypothetical protein
MRPLIPTLLVVAGACCLASLRAVDHLDSNIDDQSEVAAAKAKILVMKARSDAVEELLAGRLSFPETAERFRQLVANDPSDPLRWMRMFYPGCSDGELYYRHVILYTETRLQQLCQDMSFADGLRNQVEEIRCNEGFSESGVPPADKAS